MQARPIPARHEVREPHSVGSASYLEASSCAPTLNVLNGSRSGSHRTATGSTSYHVSATHDDEAARRYANGEGLNNATTPSQWQHHVHLPPPPFPLPGFPSAMPDAPWPMPEGLPHIPPPPPGYRFEELFPGGIEGMRHMWPSPADLQMPEVFPFPPPFLPPPPFPMPWGGAGGDWNGDPRAADFGDQPVGPSHRQNDANRREATGTAQHHTGSLHPRQRPTSSSWSRGHQGASDDLPWLAPPPPQDPANGDADDAPRGGSAAAPGSWPQQRRSSSTASYAEEDRLRALAENARHHFLKTRSATASSAATDADTGSDDRHAGRQQGRITSAAPTNRPTERRTYRVQSDYRATTGARLTPEDQIRLKQEREARINARRNSVHNRSSSNHRSAMSQLRGGSPSVSNRVPHPSTKRSSSGVGVPTRRNVLDGTSDGFHRDHPKQRLRDDVPTDEGSTSSRHRDDELPSDVLHSSNGTAAAAPPLHRRKAAHPRASNDATVAGRSPRIGSTTPPAGTAPQRASSAANHTPHRLFPSASESRTPLQARRASRGVTISALKGETPDLKRTLRDGLPSEQQRLRDFRLQRASQRSSAATAGSPPRMHQPVAVHRDPSSTDGHPPPHPAEGASTFIGFGATQYTPFVELAKKDPRAAEYLHGIEHLYQNLRKSYESFQRNPEQFLKGPSLAAIQEAARSPPRRTTADDGTGHQQNGVGVPAAFSSRQEDHRTAVHPSVTPPRLPLHDLSAGETFLARDAEPSAETRMLREELDRLEHQWQKLSELRGSGESGAGPVEAIPPAATSGAAYLPTKGSVTKKVRDQLHLVDDSHQRPLTTSMSPTASPNGSRSDAFGDVFSYGNVMEFVRERKMLHQQHHHSNASPAAH